MLRDTTLESITVRSRRRPLSDVTIERCVIDHVHVGDRGASVDGLLRVERLKLQDVTFAAPPYLGPAFWDSCVLDGVKVSWDVGFIRGFFRHCVLRGRNGRLLFRDEIGDVRQQRVAQVRRAVPASAIELADANRAEDMVERYRVLDWALDIREAQFVEPMSFDLPGRPFLGSWVPEKNPSSFRAARRDRAPAPPGTWRGSSPSSRG